MTRLKFLIAGLVCTMAAAWFGGREASVSAQGAAAPAGALAADALSAFTFRNIGPTIHTGRIQDVAIDPKNTSVWYVASAFGGVWKTQNRGITFEQLNN